MADKTPYDQWVTECPYCHGELKVVSYILTATGKRWDACATLHSDGFEVDAPEGVTDFSTEDEYVRCSRCHKEYTLSELTFTVYPIEFTMMDASWELLRKQKQELLKAINEGTLSPDINGIIFLLDHIQDYSVDKGFFSEAQVFGEKEED